jgi:hypothetical protein
VIFGKEEDPVGDIAAAGDGAQGGRAVEATVDAAAAVAAERPGLIADVWLAVGADKYPGLWQDIQRCKNGIGIINGLVGLAEIAAIQGQGERSGWLFGAGDNLIINCARLLSL